MKRALRSGVVAGASNTYCVVKSSGYRFYGFIILLLMVCGVMRGQCNNYQVYESFTAALPTSGGTWSATSMTYDSGTARTGTYHLTFNASGDIIRTPLISFWYRRSTNTDAMQLIIETSPDNSTWTSRGSVSSFTASYTQFSVDLGALSLTNVYVRIRDARATGIAARYVDDISWTSTVSTNNTLIPSLVNCSQTINSGTSYIFSDAGTQNDTYNASTDHTITFTPSAGTEKIQLIFSSFNTENYDGMVIYNGPNSSSSIISSGLPVGLSTTNCPAGSYYGTTSPGTITSTHASGSITIRFRSDNTTNNPGWLATVNSVAVLSCTAPPTAGTAVASPTTVDSGGTTNLSLTGTSTGSGLTYQWQSSTTSGSTGFANISGATSATYTATPTNLKTWYRCIVTCSGSNSTSTAVEVNMNYCTSAGNTSFETGIRRVVLNTLDNSTPVDKVLGYTHFTTPVTNLTAGSSYNLSVYVNTDGASYTLTTKAWIDWNQNGFFDASETYDLGTATGGASVITTLSPLSITVPVGAVLGNTRMRVTTIYGTSAGTPAVCNSTTFDGETEDYTINVVAPSASPSLAITGTTAHGATCSLTATTSQTYTITNTGTAIASGITVVSSDPQFVVSGLSSTSIAGTGGTATYTVTFTPSSAGAKTATITVASTTSGSNSPTSNLTGTGTATVAPSVTSGAATVIGTNGATLNASASIFGACPTTIIKGFVISQTSANANPLIGGTGVTNEEVTVLGTQGAFLKAITGLLPGTQYSYKAYLYNGTTYTYGSALTFTTLTPPANDLCASATDLTVNATATSGTLLNATLTAPFGDRRDVWYKFTAPCDGRYTITVGGFTGNVDVYLYNQSSSCPTTAANIGHATSGAGTNPETLTSALTPLLTNSTIYFIRVSAANPSADGTNFTISVSNQIAIVTQPTNQIVGAGTAAFFGVSAPANQETRQWQVSTDNGFTWTNIAGATASPYVTPATTMAMNGYQYRAVITNGTCYTINSNPALLTVNYCTPASWTHDDSEITNVALVGAGGVSISNPTTGCTDTVQNYTSQNANVNPGVTYTVAVTFGDCDGGSAFNGAGGVWIDWNGDGDFADVGETIGTVAVTINTTLSQTTNFSINVPPSQPLGNYRMRIVQDEGGSTGTVSPCASPGYGSIEDYTISVVAGTTDTRLNFATATYTSAESAGTANLCVTILNPSPTVATTANVVKTTVTGTHISTTTFPITFPAGSSSSVCVAIPITENTVCGDTATYNFELQAVSGGIAAASGTTNATALTVNDNDAITGIFRRLDFEGCNNWGYTTSGDALIDSEIDTYNGDYSMSLKDDATLTLNNIDLTGYSNVTLSVAYAAYDVDADDDLMMDVSYDNGVSWTGTGSTKLVDGFSNLDVDINTTYSPAMPANNGSVTSNPFTINIPSGSTQVRVRFRAVNTDSGGYEYYYIDDVILRGDGCNVTPAISIPQNTPNNVTYISEIKFVGTQNDITNTSTFSTSPSGYQDFTGLPSHASQIQGEGVNIKLTTNGPIAYATAWIDINKDGDFEDVGEFIFDTNGVSLSSTTFGYEVPLTLAPGDYRIRIRIEDEDGYSDFDSCETRSDAGETEDYLLTVIARCPADIETVTKGERCGTGTVVLQASTISSGVTQFRWYTSPTGGTPLTSLNSSGSTTFNTPSIAITTTYYVAAFNGTCETQVRRAVVATVKEIPDVTFTPATPVACGDNAPIELAADDSLETIYLVDENFDLTGGLGAGGTSAFEQKILVSNTDEVNGIPINGITKWEKKTSTFTPEDGEDSWLPAISSGFGTNKFAFSTSDIGNGYTIDNTLELRNAINTTGYQNLNLKFRMYFSRYTTDNVSPNDEYVSIEVSTDGGTTYAPLSTPKKFITDIGTPGSFATETVNLSSYVNQTNLKFRIRHYADLWGDGVAVDDIQIYGSKTLTASYEWIGSDISVFTDAACTITYVEGAPIDRVYIIPGLVLLEQPTFTINIKTTLTNGCELNQPLNVTNNSKVWAGTTTDWNTASNWKPSGIPTNTHCIIVPDIAMQPIIPVSPAAVAKTVEVKNGATLEIPSGRSLTVTEAITVEPTGLLEIKDSGSLVQVTDPPLNATLNSINNNTGEIRMERISKPMYKMDYTYWSSPVTEDSNFTLYDLSEETPSTKFYKWGHEASTPNWVMVPNGAEAMVPGRGYIVRAPLNSDFPLETPTAIPGIYTATFEGKPNNGIVRHNVTGSTVVDRWNLIGNPYPSAISADKFLHLNADPLLNTVLSGTLYFWTHNTNIAETAPGAGIYTYNAGDYASWNKTGGTSTRAATDVANGGVPGDNTINSAIPSGYIAAGQAFFAKGIETGAVIFNNDMREATQNNQFFRPGTPEPINNWDITGKHRVWLNLKGETKGFCQTLVGYIENATNDLDNLYDGDSFGGNQVTFYSVLATKKLVIQGRSLPFNNQDEVPLGYKTSLTGTLTISIDDFDGLFSGQDIYLEDKLLNIVHDLKASAYNFTTASGTFDERFVLRYLPAQDLGTPGKEAITKSVLLFQEQNTIFIKSPLENLQQVTIYDLLGRIVYQQSKIGATDWSAQNVVMNEQSLIVKIILENGQVINKKIVY